jgi:hypothetical protein
MIFFWISVVPLKVDWTRLSRQGSQSWRRAADWVLLIGQGGLHWVSAGRSGGAVRSGSDRPPGDRLAAPQPPGRGVALAP